VCVLWCLLLFLGLMAARMVVLCLALLGLCLLSLAYRFVLGLGMFFLFLFRVGCRRLGGILGRLLYSLGFVFLRFLCSVSGCLLRLL